MWKFEAPLEVQNIDNYQAAVEAAKKELASLNEQIIFAVEQKSMIESGNDELSKLRMDKIYAREDLTELGEKELSEKRSAFALEVELFNEQRGKYVEELESFNQKKADFLTEIKLKSDHLLSWENELRIKEDGLTGLEKDLRIKDHEHKNISDKIASDTEKVLTDFDLLKKKLVELDAIRAGMMVDSEMLAKQKEELSAMCDANNASLEEIKKTKIVAENLKHENAKKSAELDRQVKMLRDGLVEQRRIETENNKKSEALRHQEEQIKPHIQKLESLKDHIAQTGGVNEKV